MLAQDMGYPVFIKLKDTNVAVAAPVHILHAPAVVGGQVYPECWYSTDALLHEIISELKLWLLVLPMQAAPEFDTLYIPTKGEARLIDLLLTDGAMERIGIAERLRCAERTIERRAERPIEHGYIVRNAGRYSAT